MSADSVTTMPRAWVTKMSWISESHSQWHALNGLYEPCPLDCGIVPPEQAKVEALETALEENAKFAEATNSDHIIRCGRCGKTHHSVAGVRWCYYSYID